MVWPPVCLGSSVVAALVAAASSFGLPAQRPQFRAEVSLVSVEVRVLDGKGLPVSGLTAADFTIRENGVGQRIEQFQAVSLAGNTEPTFPGRTFVVVLGRGRLNKPTNALEALGDFVRSSLLPGDRISLITYLHASDFTTDHAKVAKFLDAFRERHEHIEGLLAGDRRVARPPVVRKATRDAIQGLFGEVPGLRFRDLPGGAGDAASRYEDFGYMTNALRYLATLEGEKHVVFVSQGGLPTGMVGDALNHRWVRLATAARSTVSVIHAGGIGRGTDFDGWMNFGAMHDMRTVANLTGGTATYMQYAREPLTALDRATRVYYILGYYPQRPVAPDQFRHVSVSVQRPGVQLKYRHGYLAKLGSESPADFRRELSDVRLAEAAQYLIEPPPQPSFMSIALRWKMRLTVPQRSSPQVSGALRATVAFDPTWVTFIRDGEHYVTDLDLLLLAYDEKRAVIGEHRQHLKIRLTPTELARTEREWLTFDAAVDVSARPTYLRAVLYDFETDRTSTAQVRVK
jgi:VWFA-related protein